MLIPFPWAYEFLITEFTLVALANIVYHNMVSPSTRVIVEDFITVLALNVKRLSLVHFCDVSSQPGGGGVTLTTLVTDVASQMSCSLVFLKFKDVKIRLGASRMVTFECSFRIFSMDSLHMLIKTVGFFATFVTKIALLLLC